MSTYREVLRLQNQLLNDTSVVRRRKAADELQTLLSDYYKQVKLAAEASNTNSNSQVSVPVARRHALSFMWQGLISSTVVATEQIISSKRKIALADIQFFQQMVFLCTSTTIGFEEAYNPTKLSKNETKLVMNLIFWLMNDENALAVGETVLLRTLATACSSNDFVYHFRPTTVKAIFEHVVKPRILKKVGSVREEASEVLGSLIKSAKKHAISLDAILPETVRIVSELFSRALASKDDTFERMTGEETLLGGIITLLRLSPEQSIGPLTRYGRALLSFAMARYNDLASSEKIRGVLHEYFLAHLYVSQVAGRLQGLMPGDVGNMGKASLSYKRVGNLLEIVMAKHMRGDYINDREGTIFRIGELEDKIKLRLEVLARFFAVANRQYWSQAESIRLNEASINTDAAGDLGTIALNSLLPITERLDETYMEIPHLEAAHDDHPSRDFPTWLASPFVVHIMKPIFDLFFDETHSYLSPFLTELARRKKEKCTVVSDYNRRTKILVFLHILCAACELFPTGLCWAESNGENDNCRYSWMKLGGVDEWGASPLQVQLGSSYSLACLVELLDLSLISSGGLAGDSHIQLWSLICLRCLTTHTAVQSYFDSVVLPNELGNSKSQSSSRLICLEMPWRNVWRTLFRSDLRYQAQAQHQTQKTVSSRLLVGLRVISLVESMVCCFCTDPERLWETSIQARQNSFLFSNQDDIWRLPLFTSPDANQARCLYFELLHAVLYTVGLSESGRDSICCNVENIDMTQSETIRRRDRLLVYCLEVAETGDLSESVMKVLSSCLNCLTGGMEKTTEAGRSTFSGAPEGGQSPQLGFASSCPTMNLSRPSSFQSPWFQCLWRNPLPVHPSQRGVTFLDTVRCDFPLAVEKLLTREMKIQQCAFSGADFVSDSYAAMLYSSALSRLLCLLHSKQNGCVDEGEQAADDNAVTLFKQSSILKLLTALECSRPGTRLLTDVVEPFVGSCKIAANRLLKARGEGEIRFLSNFCQAAFAFAEGNAYEAFCIPSKLTESLKLLLPTLLCLLDSTSADDDTAMTLATQHGSRAAASVLNEFMEGDDSDAGDQVSSQHTDHSNTSLPSTGKRQLNDIELRRIKRKVADTIDRVPSHQLTVLTSLLLIAIEPSYKTCDAVAKALFGVKNLFDNESTDVGVDTLGGIAACQILCVDSVVNNPVAVSSKGATTVTRIAHVVKITCSNTNDASLLSFRFECCVRLIMLCSWAITLDEMNAVLDLLSCDKVFKSVEFRPALRAQQLRAAVRLFELRQESIHAHMDKEFPKWYVLPSLVNLDGAVRRQGALAVAASLKILPEDKVIASVQKRFPTLLENDVDPYPYQTWYSRFSVDNENNQVWDDARISVESGVLDCWCIMIEAASNLEQIIPVLYDLVCVAVQRPDLEKICFQCLRRTAMKLGYLDLEHFFFCRTNAILCLWIESSDNGLLELPLLLTAPNVIRQVLFTGIDNFVKMFDVRSKSSRNFIARNLGDIVILILNDISRRMTQKSIATEYRIIFEDRFMIDVASAISERSNSKEKGMTVHDILLLYLPQLVAYQSILACGGDTDHQIALTLESLLHCTFTEAVVSHTSKNVAPFIIRRFFDLTIRHKFEEYDQLQCLEELVARYGENEEKNSSADYFAPVQCTTLELFVYARYWLSKAKTSSEMKLYFAPFRIMISHVLQNTERKNNQKCDLQYFFEAAFSYLNDEKWRSIVPLILDSTEKIIHRILDFSDWSSQLRDQLKVSSKEILSSCMNLHENMQKNFLAICLDFQCQSGALHSSLLKLQSNDCVWSRDVVNPNHIFLNNSTSLARSLLSYREHVPPEIIECLVGTFNVIKALVDGAQRLGLDENDFIGASVPYKTSSEHRRLFAKLNNSFCAQALFDESSRQKLNSSVPSLLTSVLITPSPAKASCMPRDDRVLIADLAAASHYFRQNREDLAKVVNQSELQQLLRRVANLCGTSHSLAVRVAASRCVGDVWTFVKLHENIASFPQSSQGKKFAVTGEVTDLDFILLSRLGSSLVQCMQSNCPRRALVAADTLKCIVSYPEVAARLDQVDENAKQIISLFGNFPRKTCCSELCLTAIERKALEEKAKIFSGVDWDESEKEWCWKEELWRCGVKSSNSFDDWICCVVPGILISASLRDSGRYSFFRYCQRMSAMDSQFAKAIFPALVIQLLERSEEDGDLPSETDLVLHDTYIGNGHSGMNAKISKAFEIILTGCTFRKAPNAFDAIICTANLVVDTLEFFRYFTAKRFTSSIHHSKRGLKPAKTSHSSKSTNSLQQPEYRQGVPYGTILRLNGLQVAVACTALKRPSSAMFFLDMYADARFGGSTRVFTALENWSEDKNNVYERSTVDISGFSSCREGLELSTSFEFKVDECNRFLDTLSTCYLSVGDNHSAKSVLELKQELMVAINPCQSSDLPWISAEELPALQRLNHCHALPFDLGRSTLDTVTALHELDLPSTTQSFIAGVFSQNSYIREISTTDQQVLRESWFSNALNRLRWNDNVFDLEVPTFPGNVRKIEAGLNELLFESLSSVSRDDFALSLGRIETARYLLMQDVTTVVNPETPILSISSTLHRLSALNNLESIIALYGVPELTLGSYSELSYGNTSQEWLGDDFCQIITGIALRTVGSKIRREGNDHDASVLRQEEISQLWKICSTAPTVVRPSRAIEALNRLRVIHREALPDDSIEAMKLHLQDATILEGQGDFRRALRQATQIVKLLQREKASPDRDILLSEALITTGDWMGKHKVAPARSALETYLKPGASFALASYTNQNSPQNALRASSSLLALSHIAFNLFETVSERVESRDWHAAGQILADRESELNSCKVILGESQQHMNGSTAHDDASAKLREDSIYCVQLERHVLHAKNERAKVELSVNDYRILALRSITSALVIADKSCSIDYSRDIFRLVSLWFSTDVFDEDLKAALQDIVSKVPSFRFVPLACQLFARLGQTTKSVCLPILEDLIFRLCRDHPFHCLHQLLCLSNGMEIGEGVGGRGRSNFLDNASVSKVDAARSIIKRLKEDNADACVLVENYEILTNAYINLALAPVADFPRGAKLPFTKISSPAGARLDRCLAKQLSVNVPCVLTKPPPIRPSCDYCSPCGDLIGAERIIGFEKTFSVAPSGISRPKIVTCLGSNGSRFIQLVKGHDEVRQDAVMEQLFCYVNELLRRRQIDQLGVTTANESSQHCFRIVTYNIVPLSPTTGILEWMEDTIPFSNCVVESRSSKGSSLQSRYFPSDWSNAQCMKLMQGAKAGEKRAAFHDVCENFSPCFRYFFVERFGHSMQAWYTAKQQFCMSVAVSSIVGHILGIGDRHGSNILIHELTGEVVHIDFGIVFEQGKLLTVPEIVPFRLTQNIVDGLGPLGTCGLFTTVGEQILHMLKQNSSALLTILSAVVSDPLYSWCMSPVKARQRQGLIENESNHMTSDSIQKLDTEKSGGNGGGSTGEQNEAAAAAISKIKEKLSGYEDGTNGEQQSVPGQFELLLHSARDPDKLCEMFHGWQPWV